LRLKPSETKLEDQRFRLDAIFGEWSVLGSRDIDGQTREGE